MDVQAVKIVDLKGFYGLFRMYSDELVVPIIGVEPTTFALRMRCSTN